MKGDFVDMLDSNIGGVFKDLYLTSRAVTWSCLISFVWSIIFIYLMSAFAETIAWIVIGLVQIGLPIASAVSLFYWNKLKTAGLEKTKQTE
jgi:hypothetical protein